MKKINNKILVIGLVVLVAIFVLARVFRAPKLEGNIRRDLVTLDISKVTEIRIATTDSSRTLLKENGKWNADSASVASMLQTIHSLKATRMASRKKEKWSDFKVDSTATHVTVFYGGDKEADFYVGKLDVQPGPNNQGFNAQTYVRLEGEDEVYVVEGFLGGVVNAKF